MYTVPPRTTPHQAFLGEFVKKYTGHKDCTFHMLHQHCGVELCIPVTNINTYATELLHVKTTPGMPVRLAVKISM
jgi:arachidonate 5-lipoxygenase